MDFKASSEVRSCLALLFCSRGCASVNNGTLFARAHTHTYTPGITQVIEDDGGGDTVDSDYVDQHFEFEAPKWVSLEDDA
jgi:hypothetical protein